MNSVTAYQAYQAYKVISDYDDVRRVSSLASRMGEIAAAGHGQRGLVVAKIAAEMGVSPSTLRRQFDKWRVGGDVAMADKRKIRKGERDNIFYSSFLEYARNAKNDFMCGYRDMLRDIRAGREFPFGTWRDLWARDFPYTAVPAICPANFVPRDFCYNTMMARKNRDAAVAMSTEWSRRGQFAALKYTLPVIRSRVGLHPGEVVQADDVWHNFDVFATGIKGVFNPLEFAFYDVASAFKVVSAMKPRVMVIDPKTGKETRDNLKEFQFRIAVAHLMCDVGFYKGGITLVGERGTTALRETVLQRIAAVPGYGRLFKFQTSGVKNQPAARDVFMGNGGGNPRMKSLCECAHNILHNATAGLLGNHGRDAAHKTENQAAVIRYSEDILEQARRIDADIIPLLQLPILDYSVYQRYFYAIESEVMDRTDHRLEGWQENHLTEYRLSLDAPWRPIRELTDMPQDNATAVSAVISTNPAGLMRQRKMSRREVWAAGLRDLERWPIEYAPAFLDPRDAKDGVVRPDGTIAFTDATYYTGQMKRYVAQYTDRKTGVPTRLSPGARVRFYWIPIGKLSEQIWLTDESDNIVGMCRQLKTAAWADPESIKVAMGQQMKQTAELMAETRSAGAGKAAAQMAAREINRALIEGAKVAKAVPVTYGGAGDAPGDDFLEQMNDLGN